MVNDWYKGAIMDGQDFDFDPFKELDNTELLHRIGSDAVRILRRRYGMSTTEKQDDMASATNPKDALATKKFPMHCVSCAVLAEMGLGMMEGGRKYGTHNYREKGVRASVYFDAAIRHLYQWWEGEDIDSDSGLSHVTKALTTLCVLRDGQLMGNVVDDRPIQLPDQLDSARLNAHAEDIIARHPECKVEPYTEKNRMRTTDQGHCGLGCTKKLGGPKGY